MPAGGRFDGRTDFAFAHAGDGTADFRNHLFFADPAELATFVRAFPVRGILLGELREIRAGLAHFRAQLADLLPGFLGLRLVRAVGGRQENLRQLELGGCQQLRFVLLVELLDLVLGRIAVAGPGDVAHEGTDDDLVVRPFDQRLQFGTLVPALLLGLVQYRLAHQFAAYQALQRRLVGGKLAARVGRLRLEDRLQFGAVQLDLSHLPHQVVRGRDRTQQEADEQQRQANGFKHDFPPQTDSRNG